MEKSCQNCEFWHQGEMGLGTCHRMPPQIINTNDNAWMDAMQSWQGFWPVVNKWDSCGEFQFSSQAKDVLMPVKDMDHKQHEYVEHEMRILTIIVQHPDASISTISNYVGKKFHGKEQERYKILRDFVERGWIQSDKGEVERGAKFNVIQGNIPEELWNNLKVSNNSKYDEKKAQNKIMQIMEKHYCLLESTLQRMCELPEDLFLLAIQSLVKEQKIRRFDHTNNPGLIKSAVEYRMPFN